jgi:phosphopantothenoylcysteine synthetase/decarboxylase
MKILVTAGNTQVLIDQVRCITNIFTGRTGTSIALHCHDVGHSVSLLTSHPELVSAHRVGDSMRHEHWHVRSYRTFAELHQLLHEEITTAPPDAIVHCAAVSDYQSGGIFAAVEDTWFDVDQGVWKARGESLPRLKDMSSGKVKSNEPELWLRLVRTPKLIDLFRPAWDFRGTLVKFKLEVGVDDATLQSIAESSRLQSQADLMVANTLEGASSWALLGPLNGQYQRVRRDELPARLLHAIEGINRSKTHG